MRRSRRPNAPEWTQANVHDPGITLVDLFAFLAEALAYSEEPARRRRARRRRLAFAALVLVAVWRARANRDPTGR